MRPVRELRVVLPVYEDRESLRELLSDITRVSMPPVKLLILDDGSVRTPPQLEDLRDAGLTGEVIRLSRNVGHQRAIAVGLTHIHRKLVGCPVLVMDADGQDRADSVPELIHRFENGDAEIVAAKRARRTENLPFRLLYRLYTTLFRLLTGRVICFGNFVLLSDSAVRRLIAMPELPIHFGATVLASRLPLAFVSVDRGYRYAGASRMNLVSLSAYGMRSIMVFANAVLLRVGLFSGVAATACLTFILVEPIMKLSSATASGWFTSATGPLLVIFLQATVLAFLCMTIAGLARFARPGRRCSGDDLLEKDGPLDHGGERILTVESEY